MSAAEEAIRDFAFWNYGMDEVDPKSEYAEWVPDLAAAVEKAVREQIAHDLHNCRKCGKPHVYRELPPNGPSLRGTWADPDDGHTYYPWINNSDSVATAAAIARGEVPSSR